MFAREVLRDVYDIVVLVPARGLGGVNSWAPWCACELLVSQWRHNPMFC